MPRIPLLGGAYQARSVIAEAQRCVNLMAEKNPTDAPTQVTHYPTPGLRKLVGVAPPPPPGATSTHFSAPPADTAAFLQRDSGLIGQSDSPLFSGSIWVQIDSLDANGAMFVDLLSNSAGWEIAAVEIFTSAADWGFAVRKATLVAGHLVSFQPQFLDPANAFPIGIPVNLQWTLDTNHPAGMKVATVYLNGTLMVPDFIDDTADAFDIGFSVVDNVLLGIAEPGTGPGGALVGDATEWWVAPAQSVTLPNAGFRAGGKAVHIGGDGSSITGTAPLLYFQGALATFVTNAGPGGAFVNEGSLSDGTVNFY